MTAGFEVCCKTRDRKLFLLPVTPATTIRWIRSELLVRWGVEAESLKFCSEILVDGETVASAGITCNNNQLLINPRNRGAPVRPAGPPPQRSVFPQPTLPSSSVSASDAVLERKIDDMMALAMTGMTRTDCRDALRVAGFNIERAADLLLEMGQWTPLGELPFSYADVAFLNSMSQIGLWSNQVILQEYETSQRDPELARSKLQQISL